MYNTNNVTIYFPGGYILVFLDSHFYGKKPGFVTKDLRGIFWPAKKYNKKD